MQCLGYSGFWVHCPTPQVGLLPFEQNVFGEAATILAVAALAFLVVFTTLTVWRTTDGFARGSGIRFGGRDETIARTRRHVAACRSRSELVGRARRYRRACWTPREAIQVLSAATRPDGDPEALTLRA